MGEPSDDGLCFQAQLYSLESHPHHRFQGGYQHCHLHHNNLLVPIHHVNDTEHYLIKKILFDGFSPHHPLKGGYQRCHYSYYSISVSLLGARLMPSSITNHSTICMPSGSILPDISCQVPVYYLNADFDYWNMLDWNRPDIDCLHTVMTMTTSMAMTMTMTIMMAMTLVMMQVGPPLPMPEQMTICLRTLHYTFLFPKFSYAFAFFFGSLLSVCLSVYWFVCLFVCWVVFGVVLLF